MTDISGVDTTTTCEEHAPLFLSETDLENQGNRYFWRRGVASTVNNLFRTPREAPEFPRVFQNTPKRAEAKVLPFAYKAFQKQKQTTALVVRAVPESPVPTITIPKDTEEEEPQYAPTTP